MIFLNSIYKISISTHIYLYIFQHDINNMSANELINELNSGKYIPQ